MRRVYPVALAASALRFVSPAEGRRRNNLVQTRVLY